MNTQELDSNEITFSKQALLPYTIGPLLYSPALNNKISDMIIANKYGKDYSLALCLEDSIGDHAIYYAEEQLKSTLKELNHLYSKEQIWLPKIFIRIRNPKHLLHVYKKIQQ